MEAQMKKSLIAATLLVLLSACANDPGKEQPGASVEERTPGSTTVRPPATTQPVQPQTVQTNPLKDPDNILSKRSVYYDYDSDAIKEQYRPLLQAHAKYLAEHSATKMLIQGNCDDRGSREYNIALGQRRAEGVKRMLTLLGAAESQVEPVSLGEEKPRCTTDKGEPCYAENRRSDLLYSGEY
jgi:peptidoglycan-associated lipoprotein